MIDHRGPGFKQTRDKAKSVEAAPQHLQGDRCIAARYATVTGLRIEIRASQRS